MLVAKQRLQSRKCAVLRTSPFPKSIFAIHIRMDPCLPPWHSFKIAGLYIAWSSWWESFRSWHTTVVVSGHPKCNHLEGMWCCIHQHQTNARLGKRILMSLWPITFDWLWLCILPAKQPCLVTNLSKVHRLSVIHSNGDEEMRKRLPWMWFCRSNDPCVHGQYHEDGVPISDLYSQDLVLFIDQCMAQWQIESLSALWWTVNGFPPSHPCHPFLSWLLNIIIMGKGSSSCPAIHPLPATRLIFCSMSLSHHPVQRTASPLRNSSQYRIESPL